MELVTMSTLMIENSWIMLHINARLIPFIFKETWPSNP